ncbi:hypothetical protein N8Z69_03080 [Candidatus Thioglobus sp.]|nr:hypothetical protein [Candidatus Thioglobus sp.]
MIFITKKLLVIVFISFGLIACSQKEAELDYSISDGKFYTSENEVPVGCIAQLMTELNGDNSVASIYLNRNSMRGCIDANIPFPGGNEEDAHYWIEEVLDNHQYKLNVCQRVEGSMGSFCDKIIVQFASRNYISSGKNSKVLSLEKIGNWEK